MHIAQDVDIAVEVAHRCHIIVDIAVEVMSKLSHRIFCRRFVPPVDIAYIFSTTLAYN